MPDSVKPNEESYDRPRERLARTGVSALGNRELLALVLGHGGAGRTATEMAAAILKELGGVHGLAKASPDRLGRLNGMGPAQSSRVLAAIELGRRTLLVSPNARLPLREPDELASFLLPMFGSHSTERFGAVLLDARHRLLRVHLVSEGSLDSAPAIPRDVLREATISQAASIVVFHNHPSGDVLPSREDFELTARLIDAGKIVGIDVIDHLILGDTVYCSIRRVYAQLWLE
ncbi:MAG TPA: DNA repair protein RadC [Vicinamibacterales bacterium]|nr:DNA repair protein RadC [Vicinamibacterales bacterium]